MPPAPYDTRPSAGGGRLRRAFDWAFRSRATGRLTLWQLPNVPLVLFGVLRAAEALGEPQGTTRVVVHGSGSAALAWWSLDEVLRGESPFRRVLGGVVAVGLLAGLLQG